MKQLHRTLVINMIDLDHILDVDIFENDRKTPPSSLFLEGLHREMELNGINSEDIDIISIKLN